MKRLKLTSAIVLFSFFILKAALASWKYPEMVKIFLWRGFRCLKHRLHVYIFFVLSANKLTLALRVPSGRITQILNARRGINAEAALRLSRYFGNSPRFWMNHQTRCELAVTERKIGQKVSTEVEQAAWDFKALLKILKLHKEDNF